jgi:hypothetical protein
MNTLTILVVALVLILVCIIGFTIALRRGKSSRLSRRIVATITKIEVEATSVSSGWVVTAQSLEIQPGQVITFRSHRLQLPPRYQIGGSVTVAVDPRKPAHYRMEL